MNSYFLLFFNLYFILFLSPSVPIVHDTLQRLNIFYFFSNSLRNGEWPLWSQIAGFGTSTAILQSLITPINSLFIVLAKVLPVKNAIPIYKISIWCEVLFFSGGILYLCNKVYRSFYSKAFVYVTTLLSMTWLVSINFNFYILYTLPWMFALWMDFIEEPSYKTSFYLAFMSCFTCYGNVLYYIFLIIPINLFFIAPLVFKNKLKKIPYKYVLFYFVFCFVFLLPLAILYLKGVLPLSFFSRIDGVTVGLKEFLHHGGIKIWFEEFFEYAIKGQHVLGDQTFYFGLITWGLATFSIFKVRTRFFLAFFLPFIFILLFSQGGLIASLCYFLIPGIQLYRHVGYVFPIEKIFLCFIAGFAFEENKKNSITISKKYWAILVVLLFIEPVISLTLGSKPVGGIYFVETSERFFVGWGKVATGITIYITTFVISWIFINKKNFVRVGMFAGVVVDLLLFQWGGVEYIKKLKLYPMEQYTNLYMFKKEPLPSYRFSESDKGWLFFSKSYESGNVTEHAMLVLNKDVCTRYPLRLDLITLNFQDILKKRDLFFENRNFIIPREDIWLSNALSCGQSKLKFLKNKNETTLLLQPTLEYFQLNSKSNLVNTGQKYFEAEYIDKINFKITHFTNNRINVFVDNPNKEKTWLYISQNHNPLWSAIINNQATPIHLANFAFQAVPLVHGKQTISLFYDSNLLRIASYSHFILSLLFALFSLTLLLKKSLIGSKKTTIW